MNDIQRIHKQEIQALEQRIENMQEELQDLLDNCPHKPLFNKKYSFVKCEICDEVLGDYCKKSPNNICEYHIEDEECPEEVCKYCGQPEERK